MFLPNRQFMQMCWVVPDVKEAAATWTKSTGVGPFFYFESVEFENPTYKGMPSENPEISAVMAQAGDTQIELIQQNVDKPTFITDVVPYGQSGFHHTALYSTDYDADLDFYAKAGVQVAFNGLMMGARVCWLDTTHTLGFMIELIEANTIADAVFGQFKNAAEDWDGSVPLRTMG